MSGNSTVAVLFDVDGTLLTTGRSKHDGKEGVDGSSPSEGFRFPPAQTLFPLSLSVTMGGCGVHRTSKAWTSAALMSA
jgi:hypothetical protein